MKTPTDTMRTAADGRLPRPPAALYPCSHEGCREDRTWPPDDLSWFDGQPEKVGGDGCVEDLAVDAGWYCGECASELGIDRRGPRLDEVLGSEGRPAGDDGADPAPPGCGECAFYGANTKRSTDKVSRELLETTHAIADDDCCHPTSLIARGNGVFDDAHGMRRGWCGYHGVLFTPWPRRQGRRSIQGRVVSVGPKSEVGAMHRVRVAVEPAGAVIDTTIGSTTVERLELKADTACRFTLAHRPDGRPDTAEWTKRDEA